MRNFTSLLTAFSFLAMAFSGAIAFVMPQGRIAYWNNWALFGLDKTAWSNIHIATGLLFLIAGIIHTCLNWKTLVNYLSNRRRSGSRSRVPLLAAVTLTLFFSIGAVLEPPPLRQLFDFNARVKEAWIDSPAQKPPFGHAELKPLAELCDKQKINLDEALSRLVEMGFQGITPEATLKQIATLNQRSPAEIYALLRPAVAPATGNRYTAELVVQHFDGTGIGRKKLAEICRQFSIGPERAAAKLAERNWTLKRNETIKDAADRYGVSPIEILQTLLNGEKII
ncbi:hypothetical protein C2E25_04120 [Geothermobacter hydrogeniphilus]|uniref:Flavinylation-associated cytochrome domain-containing protein n=1 Tax=Geothermobacter hydrogeniphilus TaxID=1969733 RepID=A0A2K2HCF4_9BACT|nr:DUF4405 domain-containing protein [Geothermobacter hydrogeniphilus]PNU20995.1 hypothetical protein C2E25_04120 [Geothermobacter hydrogeniphilus]